MFAKSYNHIIISYHIRPIIIRFVQIIINK